jgi:hypothetical protein
MQESKIHDVTDDDNSQTCENNLTPIEHMLEAKVENTVSRKFNAITCRLGLYTVFLTFHYKWQPDNYVERVEQDLCASPAPVNQKPPVYTKWTEEEDELLRTAISIYGPHKWSLIAAHVPNRTPMQCSTRWLGALNPTIHKGRWTPEEDVALKEAVAEYINIVDADGNPQPIPWNKIATHIPHRTGIQCQARWSEALDPRVRKGKWSADEDDILKEGVRRFGRCWIRIAEMINGRTQVIQGLSRFYQ